MHQWRCLPPCIAKQLSSVGLPNYCVSWQFIEHHEPASLAKCVETGLVLGRVLAPSDDDETTLIRALLGQTLDRYAQAYTPRATDRQRQEAYQMEDTILSALEESDTVTEFDPLLVVSFLSGTLCRWPNGDSKETPSSRGVVTRLAVQRRTSEFQRAIAGLLPSPHLAYAQSILGDALARFFCVNIVILSVVSEDKEKTADKLMSIQSFPSCSSSDSPSSSLAWLHILHRADSHVYHLLACYPSHREWLPLHEMPHVLLKRPLLEPSTAPTEGVVRMVPRIVDDEGKETSCNETRKPATETTTDIATMKLECESPVFICPSLRPGRSEQPSSTSVLDSLLLAGRTAPVTKAAP